MNRSSHIHPDYDFRPELADPSAFIAPGAIVIGNVTLGAGASVWFNSVARGDADAIVIGPSTNIQDLSMLHADPGYPCLIGQRVTVGHAALIHGATIEDDVLIGMRAIIMNGAVIGRGSVVAAGTLVPEGMIVPPGSVVMGMPGKVRGPCGEKHQAMIARGWAHYQQLAQKYAARSG
jgi:carbonic anhydrase/acetyltransferase-like protein (isoleucine patch superfamily)